MTLIISTRGSIAELTVHRKKVLWAVFSRGLPLHCASVGEAAYILSRCEQEGIAYKLEAVPKQRYYIIQPLGEAYPNGKVQSSSHVPVDLEERYRAVQGEMERGEEGLDS